MAEISSSQILDEIPKKPVEPNVQTVSNWRKFKKAFQAVFYFKDSSLTFSLRVSNRLVTDFYKMFEIQILNRKMKNHIDFYILIYLSDADFQYIDAILLFKESIYYA